MILYELVKELNEKYIIIKSTYPISYWAEDYCGYNEEVFAAGIYTKNQIEHITKNGTKIQICENPEAYDWCLKNLTYFAIPIEDIKLFLHILKGVKKYGRAK